MNYGDFCDIAFGSVPGQNNQYFVMVKGIKNENQVTSLYFDDEVRNEFDRRNSHQNYIFIIDDKSIFQSVASFFIHTSKTLLNNMFVNVSWPYAFGKYIDDRTFGKAHDPNNKSVILIYGAILYKILKRAKSYGIKYKVNDNCLYYKSTHLSTMAEEKLRERFDIKSIEQREDGVVEVQLK